MHVGGITYSILSNGLVRLSGIDWPIVIVSLTIARTSLTKGYINVKDDDALTTRTPMSSSEFGGWLIPASSDRNSRRIFAKGVIGICQSTVSAMLNFRVQCQLACRIWRAICNSSVSGGEGINIGQPSVWW